METIGPALARRIAIAATGLGNARPAVVPGDGHLRRVVARLGLLQIDSVSVVARAHYLPLFSRLGDYRAGLLDAAAWGRKPWLFEYWAHEASLVPVGMQPLFRWRMARAALGRGIYSEIARFAVEQPQVVEAVFERVRREGRTAASDLEDRSGTGGWWGWSGSKRALGWLFWSGRLTTATRRGSFERLYDLPERVLPGAVLAMPTPPEPAAHRALLGMAGAALGIGTAGDLRDYFRLGPQDATPRLAELVEAGELIPVQVRGWDQPGYLHRDARQPRQAAGCALVAPFDPLVWHRPRTERLFGFRYRLEIYTPAARRQHGYYVLPFLLGDALVARVDLKASRATDALLVLAAHGEPGAPAHTEAALAGELALMARWLGLSRVVVQLRGDLAAALATAVAGAIAGAVPG